MSNPTRLTMPTVITCGGRELRAHRDAVRRDGVDALRVLHHLARIAPHHQPCLRKRGVALLIGKAA
jgi:hypothetical protein